MRLFSAIAALCLFVLVFAGCDSEIDLEAHRLELLRLNDRMRTAHIEGDAETIIAGQAYPYVKVNSGRVSHPTRAENDGRFRDYMATMNVTVWDDLIDPIITISDDASLATVIYQKHLVMTPVGQPDAEPFEGIFAWQSTYRRTADGWKQISDVLSSMPEEELARELESLEK